VSGAIVSAGAAVWRPAAGPSRGGEVLLVHRARYDDWSLPKGKCEPGEHVLLTAVREVLEETSVRPVLGPRLPSTEYQVRGRPKRVEYWAATAPGAQAAASHEIDEVAWLALSAAPARLSYPHDAEVIASLRPRLTVPLILARHVSAGSKAGWPGDDLGRPLDAAGIIDALLLADLLACFAPRARVISSPAVRCVDSMRPYAAAFGGSVEAEAALTVPAHPAGRSSGRTGQGGSLRPLFRDLVAGAQPAVVCLHRENLPLALAAACAALGVPATMADPALPKGGFLVLHIAAGELAAVERYEL
jgi:8-oxo-dGTP pyrophosphatase MutT (NUDIX family)/phosphohistidine phosphatase SixA